MRFSLCCVQLCKWDGFCVENFGLIAVTLHLLFSFFHSPSSCHDIEGRLYTLHTFTFWHLPVGNFLVDVCHFFSLLLCVKTAYMRLSFPHEKCAGSDRNYNTPQILYIWKDKLYHRQREMWNGVEIKGNCVFLRFLSSPSQQAAGALAIVMLWAAFTAWPILTKECPFMFLPEWNTYLANTKLHKSLLIHIALHFQHLKKVFLLKMLLETICQCKEW